VGFLNCGMKKPRIVIRKCGEAFYRMTWNGEEECMVHMAVQWQISVLLNAATSYGHRQTLACATVVS
jgi:hypothetical protein